MTCGHCGFWLHLDDNGDAPEICPACAELVIPDIAGDARACGDSECAMHDGHCLIEGERYQPETCGYCREVWSE